MSDRPNLDAARRTAEQVAAEWGLELGAPFALSRYSYVARVADDAVLKVAWSADDESLHESEALELWAGDGAVRLRRADPARHALLEERAIPGSDISELDDEQAMAIAVEVGSKLWRPAAAPFRWVGDEISGWLDNAERDGACDPALLALARELWSSLERGPDWLVHGDFHHHNILRHGNRYVAIDPKPYLADREYDVPTVLWNPLAYELTDRERTERRIAAFVDAGLDDFRIRAWTAIRGSYLGHTGAEAKLIRSLL